MLTVRAGDVKGQAAEIAELPVTFSCDDEIGNEPSFGDIDLPLNQFTFSGTATITGWALDWDGISEVLIYVDGTPFDSATRGLPRPVVSSQFPGYPDSAAPGWSFTFDTNLVPNGTHNIQVVVRDQSVDAALTVIGERAFTILNP